ncbi:MAG: stage II sporulation protein P, partial [Firmicutes bacterium]|nr:stage II sporulation protein P [Bacillota bacterium]
MKFRAFVITKNSMIVGALCLAAVAAICAVFARLPHYENGALNESMLKRGIADDEELNIADKIKSFLGISDPAAIAENEMGVRPETSEDAENETAPDAENDAAEEIDESLDNESAGEETDAEFAESAPSAAFPSKEEISAGGHLSMNNATDYDVDLEALCAAELGFSITDDGPQVLVVHTHTTECYDGDQMSGETERTTDESKNVVAVGEVICQTLEKYGIKTYHDRTYHDYPTYQGAYTRELTTVTSILEQYPSIKVVLDVHRDAFIYEDGSKLKVDRENAECPTAKVMIVAGTDSMGLYHPNWRENLKLAAKLQNAAEIMYPGLTRSIDLRQERFNMHMTTGSLLLEVGSNGNTLEEALNAGENIAEALAACRFVNDVLHIFLENLAI